MQKYTMEHVGRQELLKDQAGKEGWECSGGGRAC